MPDPNSTWPQQSGPASPYPSVIAVSNLTGVLGKVTVTLSNLSHTFPGDINALLVSPGGAKTLLMSHAGSLPVTNLNLTFDDGAEAGQLPDGGQLASGAWQPTAYNPPANFPSNAPPGPYSAALASFNSVNPNGLGSLYVWDDSTGDGGGITNGWSLALTMISPVERLADLALSGVVAPTNLLAGGTLTYTFSITNNGSNTATSVVFTNLLPAGVTLLSANSSQAVITTNATSVVAEIAVLPVGTNATVTVVVTPPASVLPPGSNTTTLTSTANVAAFEKDLNPGNNSVSIATTVNRPVAKLGLTQTLSSTNVVAGYSLTNTIVITNNGPNTALDVVLSHSFLPTNVNFAVSQSQGTTVTNAANILANLGTLGTGAVATVTVVVIPLPSIIPSGTNVATLTNVVFLNSSSDASIALTNTVRVNGKAPVIILSSLALVSEEKINGAIDPSETVTLSLSLANFGTLDTTNLKATLRFSGVVGSSNNQPADAVLTSTYGRLAYGGFSTNGIFRFKAASVLGAVAVATWLVEDKALGYETNITFSFITPGATASYATNQMIAIPYSGAASPYPSTINVSGLASGSRVSGATVTLSNVTHSFPHDINVLLVSPSGSNVLLMSHTGGGHAITNTTLTFDDVAAQKLPNYNPITVFTNQPSSYEGPITFPGNPASKPYGLALTNLNWSSANGPWRLYVWDDSNGDAGAIASGWSLKLTTLVTVGSKVVDLAVGMTVPASVEVGSPLTNTINLTNFGPDSATGVVLLNPLPAYANYDSTSSWSSQGTLSSDGLRVTCSLGSLPVGGSAKVVIVTRPSIAGTFTNSITTSANEEDLNPDNYKAHQKTTMVYDSSSATLNGFFSSGQFHLMVTAPAGFNYVVQGSTNLTAWVSLSTNANLTGNFTFIDTNTPAPQLRFYRTKRIP